MHQMIDRKGTRMTIQKRTLFLAAPLLMLILASGAHAATVYDESINSDFTGNRALPTFVTFQFGPNDIFGETGSTSGVVDRDYFTFVIPSGYNLSAIIVLKTSLTAGGAAFFGLQSGPEVTVDPAAPNAALLLGYRHLAPIDINTDILPTMAVSPGAAGFVPPLPAGQYSGWLQDSNVAPTVYGLRFYVTAVPEPGTIMLTLTGLAPLALAFVRKRQTDKRL
jgi:hypothetical protein